MSVAVNVIECSGVYVIKNIKNCKIYIGSSQRVRQRLLEHIRKLRKNQHNSKHLQNAFNLDGEDNFEFDLLKETSELFEWEQHYCDLYKANDESYGYNIRKVVDSNRGNKITITEDTKRKISEALKGKTPENITLLRDKSKRPVDLFINGIFYKKYDSQEQASTMTKVAYNNINNQVRGRCKTLRGYADYTFSYSDGKGVRKTDKNIKSSGNKNSNRVLMINIETGLTSYFDSALILSNFLGVKEESVRSACRGRTKSIKGYKKYKFKYEEPSNF